MERAKKVRRTASIVESPESSFGSEDEVPLRLMKHDKKKQKEVQSRRSPRKRRAAARNITYNMDESDDESDIQFLGEEKNKKEDSSDYIPTKSTESSEYPSSSIQEIDENEESPSTEDEGLVAQETPRRSRKNSKLAKTPRSSERLKSKKTTRFQMPSRKDIFDDIDAHSPRKGLSEVTPRKIVNDFTKVYNRYNHDPNYTSGESSVDDFIDDDGSSEEGTRQRKRFRQKNEANTVVSLRSSPDFRRDTMLKKKKGGRIIRPKSSSSSGSEDDGLEEKKRQMNRSRIDSSSDSDAPIGPTKRRKLNSSVILDSDSGCEEGDTKEASCLQIDGVGDNGGSVETVFGMSCEAAAGMDNCAIAKHEAKSETVCKLAHCNVSETENAEDHVNNGANGSSEGAVRKPGSDAEVVIAETHPELSDKTNNKTVKDCNSVTVDQASKLDENMSKDKDMAVVVCDSEDSMDEFVVKSDEENLETDNEESSDSDAELNVSNAYNRRFIASDSESEEDETGRRRPSERAKLMEERRQAHKNKFDVFRKAHKKGS